MKGLKSLMRDLVVDKFGIRILIVPSLALLHAYWIALLFKYPDAGTGLDVIVVFNTICTLSWCMLLYLRIKKGFKISMWGKLR